jgi:ribosomal protein L21
MTHRRKHYQVKQGNQLYIQRIVSEALQSITIRDWLLFRSENHLQCASLPTWRGSVLGGYLREVTGSDWIITELIATTNQVKVHLTPFAHVFDDFAQNFGGSITTQQALMLLNMTKKVNERG